MNLNRIHLIGVVNSDPQGGKSRYNSDISFVRFVLMTNTVFKDKAGRKKESLQYHNCIMFGSSSEIFLKMIKRNQEIYIEGRVEYKSWLEDGRKVYKTEIVVEKFEI